MIVVGRFPPRGSATVSQTNAAYRRSASSWTKYQIGLLVHHMSHNCTTRNCFLLGFFGCSAWHVPSEILMPIGRTAENIAAEWSGRSPFTLGVPEVCPPKLVKKMLPMFGSNAPDDCLRCRKQCFRTSLPMLRSTASHGGLQSYPTLPPEGRGQ